MVVVAPMGTKPLLGGKRSVVPAGTASGLRMLFSSTSAGALRLNLSAMAYNESPGCTMYFFGTPVVVGAPTVVVVCRTFLSSASDELPPSVNKPEIIARKANTQVLHNRYMWSRVRRNILAMLFHARTLRLPFVLQYRGHCLLCRNLVVQ